MNGFVVIKNDMFKIASRLKEIDKNYLLVRNVVKNRFELWYNACIPKLELVFKNKTIDKRMIDYVNKTKIENIDRIIKKMDEENQKIREKEIKRQKDECLDRMYEVIKYAD